MPKYTIYLAGPMTGIEHFNYETFSGVGKDLERLYGWNVLNPAEKDVEWGFEPWLWKGTESLEETGFDLEKAMAWDLDAVRKCDWMLVLPLPHDEWKSTGLSTEVAEATKHGKEIFYLLRDEVIEQPNGEKILTAKALQRLRTWITRTAPGKETLTEGQLKPAYSTGGVITSGSGSWYIGDPPYNPYPYSPYPVPGQAWPYITPNTIPDPYPLIGTTKTTDTKTNRWTGDEVRTTSSTGGQKGMKLARYDLVPVGPLKELAEHYGKGAEKYDDNQWRKGYEWSKSFAALMRHAQQFWSGEDFDEETGSNHMAAVAWHAFTILEFFKTHPEFDDRTKSDATN